MLISLKYIVDNKLSEWYYDGYYQKASDILKNYNNVLSIHRNDLNSQLKISIRRWIEDHIRRTVIFHYIDLSYVYEDENIRHGYLNFYFENYEDAVMFKMVFADKISEPEPFYKNNIPSYSSGKNELLIKEFICRERETLSG